MATPRDTKFYLVPSAGSGGSNYDRLDPSVDPSEDDSTTALGGSNGERTQTFIPGGAGRDGQPNTTEGWNFLLSDFEETADGRTVMLAGNYTVELRLDASHSATTLGTATVQLYIGLYDVDAASPALFANTVDQHTGSEKNVGAAAVGGESTLTETLNLPSDHVFERGRVLLLTIGGLFTSPNGTLGDNTTTFTLLTGGDTGGDSSTEGAFVVLYDRALGGDATGDGVKRALTVRKELDSAGTGQAAATRQLEAFRSAVVAATASAAPPVKYLAKQLGVAGGLAAATPVKWVRKAALPASALGTAQTPVKFLRKALASASTGAAAMSRQLSAFRSVPTGATGQAGMQRVFIGVRSFVVQATGAASGRVEAPLERIQTGVTNIVKKVIQVFDD